jgi:transcriptional regulator with XRE-family HTH domain
MEDREPTVRSREIGRVLRKAMLEAGFRGSEIARKLDWSESRVSRLLTGKRGGTDLEVAEFLAVCGVPVRERARAVLMCQDREKQGWLQQFGSRLPQQVKTLIDHEWHAAEITGFQAVLVPGLLQTRDYARAVIAGSVNMPAEEIDDRVAARLDRAEIFSEDRPPRCSYFLHEQVLRMPIGGAEVMSEQLHHLLRMSVRRYITLRVVPTRVGMHAAIGGSFTLIDVLNFKPVVNIDHETSCLFLEKAEEIEAYRRILASLGEIALHEGQSREVIARVAESYAEVAQDGVAQEQLQPQWR